MVKSTTRLLNLIGHCSTDNCVMQQAHLPQMTCRLWCRSINPTRRQNRLRYAEVFSGSSYFLGHLRQQEGSTGEKLFLKEKTRNRKISEDALIQQKTEKFPSTEMRFLHFLPGDTYLKNFYWMDILQVFTFFTVKFAFTKEILSQTLSLADVTHCLDAMARGNLKAPLALI